MIIYVAYFHLTHDDWLLALLTYPHKCVITGVPALTHGAFTSHIWVKFANEYFNLYLPNSAQAMRRRAPVSIVCCRSDLLPVFPVGEAVVVMSAD